MKLGGAKIVGAIVTGKPVAVKFAFARRPDLFRCRRFVLGRFDKTQAAAEAQTTGGTFHIVDIIRAVLDGHDDLFTRLISAAEGYLQVVVFLFDVVLKFPRSPAPQLDRVETGRAN